MAILVDTSAVLATTFVKDTNHDTARQVMRSLVGEQRILPIPVLLELFQLTVVRVN